MKLKEYKEAVYAHFGVKSIQELRANTAFQKLLQERSPFGTKNPSWLATETWRKIYELAIEEPECIVFPEQKTASKKRVNKSSNSQLTLSLEASAGKPNEEAGTLVELQDHNGQTAGLLLQYNAEQSQRLIEHFRNLTLHSQSAWHEGNLSAAVVDQLGSASSLIAAALQTGQLMRVVGPPQLLQGIAAGTHQMIQASGGALGAVRSLGGGGIVGQLRFAPTSMLPVLAPVVAYQILHAIVGTQQLNQINQRLDKIQRTLEKLHVRNEATVLGEIFYALAVLDDIFEERMQTGLFTQDMSIRLAQVERSVLAILERDRVLVEYFREKAKRVKQQKGKQGAYSAAELLQEDGPQAIHDMQCLVGLIAADLKVEQARLLLAMQNNPADVVRRQGRIHKKMEDYSKFIKNLPSIKEIQRHAEDCLSAMSWWEQLFEWWSTEKKVKATQSLNLQDVKPSVEMLQPSLGGYVFWRDEQGTHILALSGDDLKIEASEPGQDDVLEISIGREVKPGHTYKFRNRSRKDAVVNIYIQEEIDPGFWWGNRVEREGGGEVLIQRKSNWEWYWE